MPQVHATAAATPASYPPPPHLPHPPRQPISLPMAATRLPPLQIMPRQAGVVKQVSAYIGLCSATHAVLAAANKSANELSSHQRKVFRIADHAGVTLAGLTADGYVLSRFLPMAAVDLSQLVKEKRIWVASFLVAWAATLQGHMMWVQLQDPFKDKFDAPNKVTEPQLSSS